jgi:hypothetical protein
MRDNDWDEMAMEFNALLEQAKEYNKAHHN